MARKGEFRRAHGRESLLQNLRTAVVNHSIVVLVGPSGSGKTALVEELTYKLLEEREDSKMFGVEVLSLDQRKVEGEPGSGELLQIFWTEVPRKEFSKS